MPTLLIKLSLYVVKRCGTPFLEPRLVNPGGNHKKVLLPLATRVSVLHGRRQAFNWCLPWSLNSSRPCPLPPAPWPLWPQVSFVLDLHEPPSCTVSARVHKLFSLIQWPNVFVFHDAQFLREAHIALVPSWLIFHTLLQYLPPHFFNSHPTILLLPNVCCQLGVLP